MSFTNKYPYTDFHELNLDWFLGEFVKIKGLVTDLDATVKQFTDFVTNYFDNLDVQDEINNKIDEMVSDGTFQQLLSNILADYEYYVTPQLYGALGDGVNDDTQAMQDAIDSGKPVIVPPGTYKITGVTVNGSTSFTSFGNIQSSDFLFKIYGAFNKINLVAECRANGTSAIVFDTTDATNSILLNEVNATSIRCFGKYGVVMNSVNAYGIYSNVIRIHQLNWKNAGNIPLNNYDDIDAEFGILLNTASGGFINENLFDKIHAQRWCCAVKINSASSNTFNNNTFRDFTPENSNHFLYCVSSSGSVRGNHFINIRNEEVQNEAFLIKGAFEENDIKMSFPFKAKTFKTFDNLVCVYPNTLEGTLVTDSGAAIWTGTVLMGVGVDSNKCFWNDAHKSLNSLVNLSADTTMNIEAATAANYHQYGVFNVTNVATDGIALYLSTSFAHDKMNELYMFVGSQAGDSKVYMPTRVSGGVLQYREIATVEQGTKAKIIITAASNAGDSNVVAYKFTLS